MRVQIRKRYWKEKQCYITGTCHKIDSGGNLFSSHEAKLIGEKDEKKEWMINEELNRDGKRWRYVKVVDVPVCELVRKTYVDGSIVRKIFLLVRNDVEGRKVV